MWRVDRAIIVLAGAGIIGIFMIVFGPFLMIPWLTIITNIGMGFLVAGIAHHCQRIIHFMDGQIAREEKL